MLMVYYVGKLRDESSRPNQEGLVDIRYSVL